MNLSMANYCRKARLFSSMSGVSIRTSRNLQIQMSSILTTIKVVGFWLPSMQILLITKIGITMVMVSLKLSMKESILSCFLLIAI